MRPSWQTFTECDGVRVAGQEGCLAHAADRDAALREGAQRPDLRGVHLDRELLDAIFETRRRYDAGHPTLPSARFDHAVFTEFAEFGNVRFQNGVSFAEARFEQDVSFVRARFDASADFRGAHCGQADFTLAVFEDEAELQSTVFADGAFHRTTFGGAVSFADATFYGAARFGRAEFHGTAELTFLHAGQADFARASFDTTTRIAGKLTGSLELDDARFGGLTTIAVEAASIGMQDVLFEGHLDATLDSDDVSIVRSRLERGGRIVVSRGHLGIRDARLARPTLIAATSSPGSAMPRLGDLAGADLSGTTLSGLDLADTRFVGAHGLDGLRIDGPPKLRRAAGGPWPRTGRLVIADEDAARRSGSPIDFEDVAGLYRDLRASQEGRKDEPGSADFYYGEMEMRRLAAPPWTAERGILGGYRAIAGYGLRPSRSLLTLALLVLGATVAFHAGLVSHPPRWPAMLLFALRSTVSFVTEPTLPGMSVGAGYVQLLLRFTGPVLLGLTAIAIRARVRR